MLITSERTTALKKRANMNRTVAAELKAAEASVEGTESIPSLNTAADRQIDPDI